MTKPPEKRRLTPEEWAKARRRWEGSPEDGYDWLMREVAAAFGVVLTRQGVRKAAITQAWVKGGEPSEPLAHVPRPGDVVRESSRQPAPKVTKVVEPDAGNNVRQFPGKKGAPQQTTPAGQRLVKAQPKVSGQ